MCFDISINEKEQNNSNVISVQFFWLNCNINSAINQRASQLNTGTTYIEVSGRIDNTQKIRDIE